MGKFYTYNQNNSGGEFIVNDNVCEYVIIEADNFEHANWLAETYGLYFNGCSNGLDCSCCGDRWDEQWTDEDGNDEPMIYGSPISQMKKNWYRKRCIIYYLDGRKEEYYFKEG